MYYLISCINGWFNTTDEKLQSEGYTIEKLIDELKNDPANKLLFVNRKPANTREHRYVDFWEFGEYV